MENITKNDNFFDSRNSALISNFYGIFVIIFSLFAKHYSLNQSQNWVILRPYFLIDYSVGGIIMTYFWAVLDCFTICTVIMLISEGVNQLKIKYDTVQSNQNLH